MTNWYPGGFGIFERFCTLYHGAIWIGSSSYLYLALLPAGAEGERREAWTSLLLTRHFSWANYGEDVSVEVQVFDIVERQLCNPWVECKAQANGISVRRRVYKHLGGPLGFASDRQTLSWFFVFPSIELDPQDISGAVACRISFWWPGTSAGLTGVQRVWQLKFRYTIAAVGQPLATRYLVRFAFIKSCTKATK